MSTKEAARECGAHVGAVGALSVVSSCGVDVCGWSGGRQRFDRDGTDFIVVSEATTLVVSHGRYPLPTGSYAVVPGAGWLMGGAGLRVRESRHRGLFMVGGPVEAAGRLRYIDGCSDTVLVAPIVRGDPCLNFLHLPPGVVQTDHEHPSLRVGLVLRGAGICVVDRDGAVSELCPGTAFVLEPGIVHRFESQDAPLDIVAWHPDSEDGPTDDDHPMLNRTLKPGTVTRVR